MEIREQLKQLIVEYYQSVVPDYQIDESKLKYDVLDDREIMQYDGMVADYVKGEDEIGLFGNRARHLCTHRLQFCGQLVTGIFLECSRDDHRLLEEHIIAVGRHGTLLLKCEQSGNFFKLGHIVGIFEPLGDLVVHYTAEALKR